PAAPRTREPDACARAVRRPSCRRKRRGAAARHGAVHAQLASEGARHAASELKARAAHEISRRTGADARSRGGGPRRGRHFLRYLPADAREVASAAAGTRCAKGSFENVAATRATGARTPAARGTPMDFTPTIDPTRYAQCLRNSRRINWDIDRDVLRGRD